MNNLYTTKLRNEEKTFHLDVFMIVRIYTLTQDKNFFTIHMLASDHIVSLYHRFIEGYV